MQRPGALDFLWNLLETYPSSRRKRLTVRKPREADDALILHPGEPVFDRLRTHVCERFAEAAQRGGVFVDPSAASPYLFHLAAVSVSRMADPAYPSLARTEILEHRLVGLRQAEDSTVESCPVEYLLLLKGGGGLPAAAESLASRAGELAVSAREFAREKVADPIAEQRRRESLENLPGRLEFVSRGFEYQDSELAQARGKLRERAQAGDLKAKGDLTRVKERQKAIAARRDAALDVLRREPELIATGEVQFLAHALVVPSDDPEDSRRYHAEVEAIAVRVAQTFEQGAGAVVQDMSKPKGARPAGLTDSPGFDLLSHRPDEGTRGIEVKGRAGVGDVELTENEWVKACNEHSRYWLYVVFDCGTPHPRLLRVRDPFGKLVVKAKGSVRINGRAVVEEAEGDRTMSTAEGNEFAEVMDRVRGWSAGLRIALAKEILDSLQSSQGSAPARGRSVEEMIGIGRPDASGPPTRGVPVESVLGMLRTDREPPNDEECRRIVEEERWKKYGS